ncbi:MULTISPECIES: MerR family transcriptional regulator [Serratia]|jgi:DNA-binding transcriptional MerR regulator|uniref:MerR family transcriptional regulator n=1 Tax=Serratia TaxID=613 RepID=UPI000CCC7211|nr:MerR family transcriptional regulator [Serratia marcescens]MBH2670478.1 MerR family transcriptional regulator [Serratia marcescens]MBH2671906.1 MerR family transcriptional regulator [Serratia marcescens]MBH3205612.1 MerR family transcriptional regulator [Serratia marcescens]MBH3299905.1 MerR family transcriptional regulator [Serratia marcescens]MDP8798898.1 MerR family transcriptional regulator [Serratia marcescens]
MKIGELAERAGVAASAIRYYEQQGLLPKAVRGVNGYRVYSESALERLHLIQIGQNLGFSLQAIQRVLALQGSAYEDGLIQGVETRLAEIERMLVTLNEQREALLATRLTLLGSGVAGLCQVKNEKLAGAWPACTD